MSALCSLLDKTRCRFNRKDLKTSWSWSCNAVSHDPELPYKQGGGGWPAGHLTAARLSGQTPVRCSAGAACSTVTATPRADVTWIQSCCSLQTPWEDGRLLNTLTVLVAVCVFVQVQCALHITRFHYNATKLHEMTSVKMTNRLKESRVGSLSQ